eukprot:15632-Heterococcus_DN1.PRE.4
MHQQCNCKDDVCTLQESVVQCTVIAVRCTCIAKNTVPTILGTISHLFQCNHHHVSSMHKSSQPETVGTDSTTANATVILYSKRTLQTSIVKTAMTSYCNYYHQYEDYRCCYYYYL